MPVVCFFNRLEDGICFTMLLAVGRANVDYLVVIFGLDRCGKFGHHAGWIVVRS